MNMRRCCGCKKVTSLPLFYGYSVLFIPAALPVTIVVGVSLFAVTAARSSLDGDYVSRA